MSAAQPKAAEPSMEEILASIRRIISDEPQKAAPPAAATPQPAAAAPQPQPAPAPAPAPLPAAMDDDDDDVMELTPKTPAKIMEPHFIPDDPVGNDLSFVDAAPPAPPTPQEIMDSFGSFDEPEASAPAPEPEPEPDPLPPVLASVPLSAAPQMTDPLEAAGTRLISSETDKAASAAFSSLATTILSKNARTLEDLMQDMMRPMIKTWLDDNLPTVVERLVRAEIERVSRGGR